MTSVITGPGLASCSHRCAGEGSVSPGRKEELAPPPKLRALDPFSVDSAKERLKSGRVALAGFVENEGTSLAGAKEPRPRGCRRGAQSLLSLFWGHLCPFFPGSVVSFFFGSLVSFLLLSKQQSRAKTIFGQSWAFVRPEFTPVFFHSGFGLGLLLLRLRPGFTPFIRYASVWVYFLVCAFFHYGFGLGLLLLRRRPGFDRFQGFGFVSSLPFTSFRVSYFFSLWAFFH